MPKIQRDTKAILLPKGEVDQTSIGTVTERHTQIANELASRHGKVKLVKENSGIHAYLACPDCLDRDGRSELYKMHLAVNIDKYLAGEGYMTDAILGGSSGVGGSVDRSNHCALCMKTGQPFLMTDLLAWQPLAHRGIKDVEAKVQQAEISLEHLEDDGRGNLIPKSPGETMPLDQLEPDHPALVYLRNRGYNIKSLQEMYGAAWCIKERDDVHYAQLKGDWKATPQGRIIFYIWQGGVRRGWQGRILEDVSHGHRYYYHPYRDRYEVVQTLNSDGLTWSEYLPPFDKKFDARKYIFPHGTMRNQLLMGYDATVAFNAKWPTPCPSYIVLTEGPLSAAKLGPPGCATMGKFFSAAQAELASKFNAAFYVHDNDAAGATGVERFIKEMEKYIGTKAVVVNLPSKFKDLGECSYTEAHEIIQNELKLI